MSDFIAKPPYNVVQPGAYSAVDASLVSQVTPAVGAPIPVALGPTLGGAPDTPMFFTSPGQLQNVAKGGPGYDLARFMFDGGASTVCVVRVGNSVTQATLALAGATGTVVTLTSLDYGSWNNNIKVTVAGQVITLQYTDPSGNIFTEQWNLTGLTLTDAIVAEAITGQLPGYTASNYVTAVAGAGTLPLAAVSAAPLTGGTDGLSPVAGDWANGLTALETQDVSVIVPATSTSTVHAQVLAHCQALSAPNARKERTAQFGGAIGETVAQAIARQVALASAREGLCYPGFYDYNAAGQITLYDALYLAGKVAGMRCALPDVATSLVHAAVPIVQAEFDLSTVQGGAIDQLLMANVTPIAPASGGGYWVVDDLTGYAPADKVFHSMNKTRSADYVAEYLRVNLEDQFIGGKTGITVTQQSVQQATLKLLDDLVTSQIIIAYLTPTASAGPNANAFSVTAPVQLIDTTKFIFITELLQPSSAIAGSTTTADLS